MNPALNICAEGRTLPFFQWQQRFDIFGRQERFNVFAGMQVQVHEGPLKIARRLAPGRRNALDFVPEGRLNSR